MNYAVRVNGREVWITLGADGIVLDGSPVAARLEEIPGTPLRLLTVGPQVHRVLARPGPKRGAYTLWIDGFRFEAEALDERARAIQELTSSPLGAAGPTPLVAPMPG